MGEAFTIIIPCKYYLKRYLELNCGYPVDLSALPDLQHEFRIRLDQSSSSWKPGCKIYLQETVELIIPEEDIFQYGFALSPAAQNQFIKLVEKHFKTRMRSYVTEKISFGCNAAKSIRDFQKDFGLPEQVLSFETIKKDLDRNGISTKKIKEYEFER